jgi:lipopolysaccharide biosynthesis glycosyltransferase/glycosyltransferase involved in cell wall biosynthesis
MLSEDKSNHDIDVVMICDRHVVDAACVALISMKDSKSTEKKITVHLIDFGLNENERDRLTALDSEDFRINFQDPDLSRKVQHKSSQKSIASANAAALQKFFLPEIFHQHDQILYLDCDLIVKRDLSEIFNHDISGKLAAVVADSGQLYRRTPIIEQVDRYFNSGVMLLNLEEMRKQRVTESLLNYKNNVCDGNLMDQDAFNVVFDKKVAYLSVRHNCLCVNIDRAKSKIDLEAFNKLYGECYESLDQAIDSAQIIHFASRDKPWKFADVRCADQWYELFKKAKLELPSPAQNPAVSIIIPVFNLEKYLNACLDSFISRELTDIEVVIVDDGSSDRSPAAIDAWCRRDMRVIALSQPNSGQSAARNNGLRVARGEYIYFLDGDDLVKPGAIAELYHYAATSDLDILYFDGECIFESDDLKEEFGHYETYYLRQMDETDVIDGRAMLLKQSRSKSFKPSACLQLFKRTFLIERELLWMSGVIYEDNLYSLQAALAAERCKYVKEAWFIRRVRKESTMTSKKDIRSYKSYITVAAGVFRTVQGRDLGAELQEFVYYLTRGILRFATEVYVDLSVDARKRASFALGSEESLFHQIIQTSVSAGSSPIPKPKAALLEQPKLRRGIIYVAGWYLLALFLGIAVIWL